MQLNENGLKDREKWESAGYCLPGFDRTKVAEETKKNPFRGSELRKHLSQ